MNESVSMLKLTIITALGVIAAYFNALLIPIAVLVAVMVIDYISGMVSAKKTGELSSRLGVIGILKKVGYLALVAVGMVVDYLISSALTQVGINIQINYCFAMIIVIWLIVNELISILENLGEIGVPIPEFLRKSIHKIKDGVENKAGEDDDHAT
ncbi:MAG: phage holin family protein [Ruminococcus sp.]|nr:phage holin family protein [Ruminococcus sp.]